MLQESLGIIQVLPRQYLLLHPQFHRLEKNIWLYTGYLFEEIKDLEIIKYLDIIVDGEFLIKLKDNNLHWKGSSNQRVIDVKNTLNNGSIVLLT